MTKLTPEKELELLNKRYESDTDKAHELGKKLKQIIIDQRKNGTPPKNITKLKETNRPTNEERLQYYRTHGLDKCDDYPGGDAQFKQDVLSGQFHDQFVTETPMKREDQYIHDCMRTGRLKFKRDITEHIHHPMLMLAYYETAHLNGLFVHHTYPGGPEQYKKDVLSGKYAHEWKKARHESK